jgi:3-(3-hydroxy-phenyl)propionate hydroxylase
VILIGDAAHVTPPFAGQGLVSGLRDVANLGWRIAAILANQLGSANLRSYETERRPHAGKMIRLAQTLGAVIMPTNGPKALLVHGLARFISLLPVVRRLFTDMKMKPQNIFDKGLFDKSIKGPFESGSHLPQWSVVSEGLGIELSDRVLGNRFTVVGFDVDPAVCLPESTLTRWERFGGKIKIFASTEAARRSELPADAQFVKNTPSPPVGVFAVIRPDKLVMCSGHQGAMNEGVLSALSLLEAAPDSLEYTAA